MKQKLSIIIAVVASAYIGQTQADNPMGLTASHTSQSHQENHDRPKPEASKTTKVTSGFKPLHNWSAMRPNAGAHHSSDNNSRNDSNDMIAETLLTGPIVTASQLEVMDNATITVSVEHTAGFDSLGASYEWFVIEGDADIVDPTALETEVTFDVSDGNQTVTLYLEIRNLGDETLEQRITIKHGLSALDREAFSNI